MKTFLRRSLVIMGGLAILLGLFHVVENYRGRRAWRLWKSAREAAGQTYDRAAFIPKAIPDADNFAAAPIVADVNYWRNTGSWWSLPGVFVNGPTAGDWRSGHPADFAAFAGELKGQRMEAFLEKYETPLEELSTAARRPGSRLKLDYLNPEEMPPLLSMRARAKVLRLRALARLQSGHAEAALEDVLTGLRMIQHLQQEPHVISQLLRMAYVNILVQPIWEGLRGHAWNEAQLVRLQAALEPIDLVASMKRAWQFERCTAVAIWSKGAEESPESFLSLSADATMPAGRFARAAGRLLLPKGWAYQNLWAMDRVYEEQLIAVLDSDRHLVHADQHRRAMAAFASPRRTPYTWAMHGFLPGLLGQNVRVAWAQSGLDLARIACALERHRLVTGNYPEDLQGLVPAVLAQVPHGVVGGHPFRYEHQNHSYRLYSTGWNGTDEGGKVDPDPEQGDWVWFTGK